MIDLSVLERKKILHFVAYLETMIYQLLPFETEKEQMHQFTSDV